MVFENTEHLLKPEMFANVTIHTESQQDAVVLPTEAIVRSGTREQIFVVRAPGKFEPRIVKLGASSGGLVHVLAGVAPGEEVVISSQFLIDSESKLREATSKMLEINAPESDPPQSVEESADGDGSNKSDAENEVSEQEPADGMISND